METSGLRLTFGGDRPVAVLGGVDLCAFAGEITAIVGPSGCGKSTLLDVIAGLRAPDSGDVRCSDSSALMPQRDALMPWLTLRENVAIGGVLGGKDDDTSTGRADSALARLGLTDFADHYPHALSGGMRQRGALARTLLTDRRAWLLDEPFGALDALTRTDMHRVLADLHDEHRPTVIIVTHDIHEAVALATRVLVSSPRPMRIVDEVVVNPSEHASTAARVLGSLRAAGVMA
ncbi:MAG: ATP-binding cassette domain-containing protein [Thermoleophilia bacterium]|nr:ATP-binding cassette domain-containing protein [Thermoleophilia bacterium]